MSKLSIRVIPHATRSEIVGREGQTWKIRLSAPPIEGKANEALIRFLADALDVAPSQINIIKGLGSRQKIVEVPMNVEDATGCLSKQKPA